MNSNYPSSMEACNGSAASVLNGHVTADQRPADGVPRTTNSYPNENFNEHESESDNNSQYQSAFTYKSHTIPEQLPGGQNQSQTYLQHNAHYFPKFTPQPAQYASHISLEEEHSAMASGPTQPRSQTAQHPPARPSTAIPPPSHQSHSATSTAPATTGFGTPQWELISHERLVLGLQRFENEEQRQQAYAAIGRPL